MAAYRQDITYYEDGYGDVTISYVLSDVYDDLFGSTFLNTDIIFADKIKKQREKGIGQLAQDSFNFEIKEEAFSTDNVTEVTAGKTQLDIDKEVLNFCKNSAKGNLFYIGVFRNTPATPDIDDALFLNTVNEGYEYEDLKWKGNQWSEFQSPLRNYKFKARPMQESILDEVSYSDVEQTVIDGYLDVLQVEDKEGFYKDTVDHQSRIPQLVSLNHFLHALFAMYKSELTGRGYGNWNFNLKECLLDGKFVPCRWQLINPEKLYGPYVDYEHLKTGGNTFSRGSHTPIKYFEAGGKSMYLVKPFSEKGTTWDWNMEREDELYVSWSNITPGDNSSYLNEHSKKDAEDNIWRKNERVDDSFVNFLYSLATDLGVFLKFTFTGKRSVDVEFQTKSSIKNNSQRIYLRDATKASGERYIVDKRKDDRKIKGVSSYIIKDGQQHIKVNIDVAETIMKDENEKEEEKGKNSLISIGSALWSINKNYKAWQLVKSTDQDATVKNPAIPFNLFEANEFGNPITRWYRIRNSANQCNWLYMKVAKRLDEDYAPSNYFTNVGRYDIEVDGESKSYESLADYVNENNTVDHRKYGNKYKITMPYLMCAATNGSGTDADLLNLQVDSQFFVSSVEYSISEIEINLKGDKPEVTISAENTGRFAISAPAGTGDGTVKSNSTQSNSEPPGEEDVITGIIAQGAISQYEYVSLVSTNVVERSLAKDTHYGRYFGIALNSAADGEELDILKKGDVFISYLTGNIGDFVFIRDVSSTQNLSTNLLFDKTADENVIACVGRIVSTNVLQLMDKEHFILS